MAENDLEFVLVLFSIGDSGIDLKEIVFHLKHNQIIKESFLDDLDCLVNNGEIQNLFSKDDYETII